MKESQDRWQQCLQMFRELLKRDDVYETWFAPLECEGFDETAGTLTLRVPSEYVYKCLEQMFVKLLSRVISSVYGNGVQLRYRLAPQEPSFANVADYLQQHGYNPRRDPYHIRIANARKRLEDGLRYYLGDRCQWLPAYDQVADWLQDNKGRGLLWVGMPGLGKSLVCEKILPVILGNGGKPIPCVSGHEICRRIDELLKERIVIIDDLGKEPAEATVSYQRRRPFFELCNNAERNGNLLIVNTNLSTTPVQPEWRKAYPLSIEEHYGREVLDRLKVITRLVRSSGQSLRA